MARVNLSHLKKVYDGNVTAVYDFDIDIKDGEFIVSDGAFIDFSGICQHIY